MHAKITRAARLAPVIKLTVKIGEKRGNNGQIPVCVPGRWRDGRGQAKSRSWIPGE